MPFDEPERHGPRHARTGKLALLIDGAMTVEARRRAVQVVDTVGAGERVDRRLAVQPDDRFAAREWPEHLRVRARGGAAACLRPCGRYAPSLDEVVALLLRAGVAGVGVALSLRAACAPGQPGRFAVRCAIGRAGMKITAILWNEERRHGGHRPTPKASTRPLRR